MKNGVCWPWCLGRYESVVVILLFLAAIVAGTAYEVVHVMNLQGDTAMFFDFINGTRIHGLPITRVNAAINEASWTWKAHSVDAICRDALAPARYDNAELTINQLSRHAYLLAYPLALLTFFASAKTAGAFSHVVLFVGIPFVVYAILRHRRLPIWISVLVCAAVAAHPVLSQGFLSNLYSDRFFMLFALLYAALLHEAICFKSGERWSIAFLFIFGFLAASTVERGAVTLAVFTVAYMVLFWKDARISPLRVPLLIFSTVLFAWFLFYSRFISTNPELVDVLSVTVDIWRSSSASLIAGALVFFTINLPFLLPAIFGNWRLALIVVGSMLPNLVFTVGGAERWAFFTHYHSLYFPFLIFALAYGVHAIWIRWRGPVCHYVIASFAAVLSFAFAAVELAPTGVSFSKDALQRQALYDVPHSLWLRQNSSDRFVAEQKKRILGSLPDGASVTTYEGMMVSVFPKHFLYYYPVGMDQADYAVLGVTKNPDGSNAYHGSINYNVNAKALDDCLDVRLRAAGYNVDDPFIVGQTAVLKRMKK
jgi:hypothetical protein